MNTYYNQPDSNTKPDLYNKSIDEKRASFLIQLNHTREASVQAYNNFFLFAENDFQEDDAIETGLSLNNVLAIIERSIQEFTNSLYEEMASVSTDIQWLEGITQYLADRYNRIQLINLQLKQYALLNKR